MSDETKRINMGRWSLSIFIMVYIILIIIMLVFGVHYKNKYEATMDNLHANYPTAVVDVLRLDWALHADGVFYEGLLWSAGIALITSLACTPHKRSDSYTYQFVACFIVMCIARLTVGFVGIGKSNNVLEIKTELSEHFKYFNLRANSRAIQGFIEQQHICCGVDGPSHYDQFNRTNHPESCYDGNILSTEGCSDRIQSLYSTAFANFGLVYILTGLYEGVGIVPAYYLHQAVKAGRRTRTFGSIPLQQQIG